MMLTRPLPSRSKQSRRESKEEEESVGLLAREREFEMQELSNQEEEKQEELYSPQMVTNTQSQQQVDYSSLYSSTSLYEVNIYGLFVF